METISKAEVNSCDLAGNTPLHKIAESAIGDSQVAALLLAHRAELSPRNDHGITPLAEATRSVGDLLLKHGAT